MQMKYALLLLLTTPGLAQTTFPLGQAPKEPGLTIQFPQSPLSLKLGARYQAIASWETEKDLDAEKEMTSQDFYSRRVRLNFLARLGETSYVMDLRNDNANKGDKGEQKFIIGDAYINIPVSKSEQSVHYLRLYRAKVDVSRSQTASSSELIFLNRAYVSDEAANYVTHNRRATNAQLIGSFTKKVVYQVVIGDGVNYEKFNDAKGNAVKKIDRQNFMTGAKVLINPISGYEELRPTETYMGEGKHFTIGAGAFNTSNINFTNDSAVSGKTSRTLINGEISAHHGEWSFQAEYFKMKGLIEDHESTTGFNKGSSEGWYAHAEKIFRDFHFIAPFLRYEKWDRFQQRGQYNSESNLFGVNWYLKGNAFKISAAYQVDLLGRDITGSKTKNEAIHLATMWNF